MDPLSRSRPPSGGVTGFLRWGLGLAVLLAVEVCLGWLLVVMAAAENCGNGVKRWECDGTIGTTIVLSMVLLAVALAASVLWRRRAQ